jgi:DNA-binding XRE family transcriptional regulator
MADVANNTIVKIEAGKNQNPTLNTIKKIAKALNVKLDDLIN